MLELDGATLTYEAFREACLKPNRPAIIRNACRGAGEKGQYFNLAALRCCLSPSALQQRLGPHALVPVYPVFTTAPADSDNPSSYPTADVCDSGAAAAEGEDDTPMAQEGCCTDVTLTTVLRSWAIQGRASSSPACMYYLKDWHLQHALEKTAEEEASLAVTSNTKQDRADGVHGNNLYRVPAFLGADWMDFFCCSASSRSLSSASDDDHQGYGSGDGASRLTAFGDGQSDYRFCYMGPVGSWTPLHCDVFGTYSWSFNVCGDKLWFFPTTDGNTYLHQTLPPLYPTPPDARVLTGFVLDAVVQHPGDLVFVPALFYHQVHNISGEVFSCALDESPTCTAGVRKDGGSSVEVNVMPLTIALNHNWCGSYNIERMAEAFLADAHRLASYLSVDDLKAICSTDDSAVLRQFADRMLHNGTNWSFASMQSFLDYCLARLSADPHMVYDEEEAAVAMDQLISLRARVADVYAHLLEICHSA